MAVNSVSFGRVSQYLKSFQLLNTVKARQLDLFNTQNQLATGLRFQTPSEDPGGAMKAGVIGRQLDRVQQVHDNLNVVNTTISTVESSMDSAIELMREAKRVTLESVNDTISADERASLATVVTSLIDQAIALGNAQHVNQYLFSGHQTSQTPFEWGLGGVVFSGDEGRRETIIDSDFSQDAFTISGMSFFGAVSTPVPGQVDLDPALTRETRISDLRGPLGEPPLLTRLVFSVGGVESEVDLADAATIGDVIDRLNAELPAGVNATIDGRALRLDAGAPIAVRDSGGGATVRTLGLQTLDATGSPMLSHDLNPKLTARSPIASLGGGAGIDLTGGLRISNGERTVDIDLSSAETIEDVLNTINTAGAGVWARLSADGDRIDVLNRVSGVDLRIEDRAGSAATNLGLRTVREAVALSDLNLGRGVNVADGPDVRVTASNGATADIDLSAARTLQDVLDAFNATGLVDASLAAGANGINLRDISGGAGTLALTSLGSSSALRALGLDGLAPGLDVRGRDVNPVRVEGAFTTLIEIRDGLLENDTRSLTFAGERLERVMRHMEQVRGEMAARAQTMDIRAQRIEAERYAAEALASDVRDVDIADAIVRYQSIETALQANMATAARVQGLSLLDFLR